MRIPCILPRVIFYRSIVLIFYYIILWRNNILNTCKPGKEATSFRGRRDGIRWMDAQAYCRQSWLNKVGTVSLACVWSGSGTDCLQLLWSPPVLVKTLRQPNPDELRWGGRDDAEKLHYIVRVGPKRQELSEVLVAPL